MTVIAVIFYKDGALVVSDSRGTIVQGNPYDPDPQGVRISHTDDQVKSMSSRSGDVVVSGAGEADTAIAMMHTLVDSEELLRNGDRTSMEELRNRLESAASVGGEAGALAAFKDGSGKVRALMAQYGGMMPYVPMVFMNEINANTAFGVDDTVPKYLDALTRKYCPDRSKTTLADAMALAFMLEDRYMHYRVEIEPGRRAVVVGGPMRMNVVSSDRNHGYATLIDTKERDSLEGKSFDELSRHFQDRVANDMGQLLRIGVPEQTSQRKAVRGQTVS